MAFKLDFKKLTDPAFIEQSRLEREAEDRAREAHEKRLRDMVEACLQDERLTEKEASLARSVRMRLNMYLLPSEAQEKWLTDIARRLAPELFEAEVSPEQPKKPEGPEHTAPSPRKLFRMMKG